MTRGWPQAGARAGSDPRQQPPPPWIHGKPCQLRRGSASPPPGSASPPPCDGVAPQPLHHRPHLRAATHGVPAQARIDRSSVGREIDLPNPAAPPPSRHADTPPRRPPDTRTRRRTSLPTRPRRAAPAVPAARGSADPGRRDRSRAGDARAQPTSSAARHPTRSQVPGGGCCGSRKREARRTGTGWCRTRRACRSVRRAR